MVIRKATSEDYKDLMSLYDDFLETKRFSDEDNDSFQKVIKNKTNYIFVAEENNKIIGLITASTRLAVRYPNPIMQVDELYVDPAYRKHGIGKHLIAEVEKVAHKNNCQKIYIESAYKHTLGHRFYEKNNYEKSGYYFRKNLSFGSGH